MPASVRDSTSVVAARKKCHESAKTIRCGVTTVLFEVWGNMNNRMTAIL